jgi:hypothetical protein
MENSFSKHYVYLHRTIEGIPFYIGIGTKQYGDHENIKLKYSRAYSFTRSSFWKRIVNKYGYTVEILLESNDYDLIKDQEVHFIKFYGRINTGEGTLCNLTDGGDGTLNKVYTEEGRKKLSNAQKKRFKNPSETDIENFKQLYQRTSVRMQGNTYAKGRTLSSEEKKKLYEARVDKLSKRVIQEDKEGNFIKEWHSTVDAAGYFGITYKAIWKACTLYHKGATSRGFKWKFKE